ncbi:hypothetical protein [Rhodoferax saidenbachensis]|uniref:Uncharacterized protein n=1 Tax=Rhodoferax saidenbachensis TaxID=1484693 RepID=A0A1P8K7P0_9BURK|nr:hypothetical protein [Rhodoferax saidenbachensis]APW42030.1 hypothetical protein RS694_05425 [Rhodoferax saidenbachensis]
MKEKGMATSNTTFAREVGRIHPTVVEHFEPQTKLGAPKPGNAKEYADLNDDSTYSMYAWEFLRRNRFYQAMVDDLCPSFDLAQWGYRPTPAHEPSFGLTHVKHYSESHEESLPHWAPIMMMAGRMQHTITHFKHHQSPIEYPGAQVAVVFDLAPVFGPGTVALQTQADFAVKYLERLLSTGNLSQAFHASDDETVKEPTNRPNRQLLRGYLRLADVLSNPQTLLSENTDLPMAKRRGKPGLLTIEQAAALMPDYDVTDDKRQTITDDQRRDRAYRYADKAWKLIYGWECLSLLKFSEWEPPPITKTVPL